MIRLGAPTPIRDKLVLLLALLVLWQVLAMVAGPHVLTTPLATLRRLGSLMAEPGFTGHAAETGKAFGVALLISLAGRPCCSAISLMLTALTAS